MELIKEEKLCRINIEQKKDLNKTEHKDYNLINTKFRTYKKERFIESKNDDSCRRQFLGLTDKGMVFVGEGLVVSANSSNSSIPWVTPMDLKEWIYRHDFILCILCWVELDKLESMWIFNSSSCCHQS